MAYKIADKDILKSLFVAAVGPLLPYSRGTHDSLGDLFQDVQKQRIYSDSKTFADLVPKSNPRLIRQEYLAGKQSSDFDLREFLDSHFYDLESAAHTRKYIKKPSEDVSRYISDLWPVLERRNRRDRGSLFALPYKYIVPGGRFEEQFYWDSYFIMLGLSSEGRWKIIEGMIKNFAYMIRKFGFIPNGNRTYYLSRSHPPFFSHMVALLASHRGGYVALEYLPYLLTEHRFWTKGRSKLAKQKHKSFLRVVEMKNGTLLNRYYDNKSDPRPESLVEDTETAEQATDRDAKELYSHIRASAESGWDFSSRWFGDLNDIRTIQTTKIIPVDLNCLLYHLELTIADAYKFAKQPLLARKFQKLAASRALSVTKYMWNDKLGFFMDYNFHSHEQTECLSLAGAFPLFVKMATAEQASRIAKVIETDFLKVGGLVTTLNQTPQQWDSPNGWAPLQYVVIQGLRNYGYNDLANEIKRRWVNTNLLVFRDRQKLVEKYNVINPIASAGGGEYTLQDGFGWTNGVLEALMSEGDS